MEGKEDETVSQEIRFGKKGLRLDGAKRERESSRSQDLDDRVAASKCKGL